MRNIFNRQVRKLQQKGVDLITSKRIAYKQQLANGNIEEGSYRLTEQGKEYSNLFSEKRAVVRKYRAQANRQGKKQSAIKSLI